MKLRPELPVVPENMRHLKTDRGYPVPWFVKWIKNVPEFRLFDQQKWNLAVRYGRCWNCGQHIKGENFAFVIGPMCAVNRTTSEPANHLECAEFAVKGCPWLSRPHAERRTMEDVKSPAGFMISRNPGVVVIWESKDFSLFPDGMGNYLIRIGDPARVRCFRAGELATPEEIRESFDSGLPFLQSAANTGGPEDLAELKQLEVEARRVLGIAS